MLKIDLTSAVLKNHEVWNRTSLTEAAEMVSAYGAELGFQIHNSAAQSEIDAAQASGLPLSFHAPVRGEWVMNFAAEDSAPAWNMAAEQVDLMKKYAVKRAVFHGGLMTDIPIKSFGHGMTFHECMAQANRKDLLRDDKSFFVRDYTSEDEFFMRRERLKKNLQLLKTRYPDFIWCVENDFPAHTTLMLRGRDLAYLEHEVCMDTGHLWASSKMLDLDFYEEAEIALNSGNVQMVHLHASRYTFDMPHHQWGDGHLPLLYPGDIDIKRVVRMCRQSKVPHIVLEIGSATLDDVKILLRYYYGE